MIRAKYHIVVYDQLLVVAPENHYKTITNADLQRFCVDF